MPIYPRETVRSGRVYDVVVAQGRKRVWKRGVRTLDEAKKIERRLGSQRDRGESIVQSALTVEQYLEDWLKSYAAGLPGKQTFGTYASNLRTNIIPVLGKRRLRDLKPKEVQDCYTQISERRTVKTALNVHRVFHEAMAHAVRLELITRNVCDKVIAPHPPTFHARVHSDDEIDRILAAADDTQYGTLCRTAVWTGLRQGELLALEWRDVDLDRAVLYVREAKHGSAGAVTLTVECVDLLRAHGIAEELKLTAFGPKYERSPYVFTNSVGRQVDAGGLKRTWRKIRTRTAIDMRFHDLRHAHAALMIRAGIHAKVLQERLRHKQISTTMDVYGHLMPGLQRDAAEKISEAMKRRG